MSFDTLAPHYRWMERVLAGDVLQLCRTAFLDMIPAPGNILLLGEGHGRFLAPCSWRFPDAHITCVDASSAMLDQARLAMQHHGLGPGRVHYIQADMLSWVPPAKTYDLIVTHFFLDCFQPDQLDRIVTVLADSAAPHANWLLADFQIPPTGWPRLRARLILQLMYTFFRAVTRIPATTLINPAPILERHGFKLHRRVEMEWGLLHSDWWQRTSVDF